jgi:hypothetical protein
LRGTNPPDCSPSDCGTDRSSATLELWKSRPPAP